MSPPSSGIETSMQPLADRDFGVAEARHLLRRAGFGGTTAEARQLASLGVTAAVDRLLDFPPELGDALPEPPVDPDVIRPLNEAERTRLAEARRSGDERRLAMARRIFIERRRDDRVMVEQLRRWWLGLMFETAHPAREKLALLWHGHFATRHREVRDAYLMYRQNAMFRAHAAGRFADLALGIVRDPAMLKFLNNERNVARRPNENLARELMELFTLGEGRYSEKDIREGARALTGYHVADNDFVFRPRVHDDGTKQILGQRGAFDGDAFVRLLLRRRECPKFIAWKLYRHLAADLPDAPQDAPPWARAVIAALARLLVRHDYAVRPVLATLLRSRHFYDPSLVGNKIKSPAELVVGTVRVLNTPTRRMRAVGEAMRGMGQVLFDPPSVAGWDGGRAWISTSTLFVRQNLTTYLISGKHPSRRGWSRDELGYDPMALLAELPDGAAASPDAVVDHLVDLLIGEHVTPARREPLVAFLRQRDKGVTPDAVIALLLLITAMPEYQLC